MIIDGLSTWQVEWPSVAESLSKRSLIEGAGFAEAGRFESDHDGRPMLTLVYRRKLPLDSFAALKDLKNDL